MPLDRSPPPPLPAQATTPATTMQEPVLPRAKAVKAIFDESISRPREIVAGSSGIQHYGSAPDLGLIMETLSERKKRKFDGNSSDNTELLKEMISKFSIQQTVFFNQLQASINGLKEQNNQLSQSVELISSKYDGFLSQITQLEAQRREDKKTMEFLEEKVEYLERKSRSTGIEIRNIPKTNGESKNDLCKLLHSVGKSIDVDIEQNAIKDIYRPSSKDSSAPIVVELTTVLLKENILDKVKKFNKSKKAGYKLNTSHIGLQCPVKPVYISETLTTKAQKLFYLARTFQKQYHYAFCWTAHGVIYMRKDEKSPHIKVSSEHDIANLRLTE